MTEELLTKKKAIAKAKQMALSTGVQIDLWRVNMLPGEVTLHTLYYFTPLTFGKKPDPVEKFGPSFPDPVWEVVQVFAPTPAQRGLDL